MKGEIWKVALAALNIYHFSLINRFPSYLIFYFYKLRKIIDFTSHAIGKNSNLWGLQNARKSSEPPCDVAFIKIERMLIGTIDKKKADLFLHVYLLGNHAHGTPTLAAEVPN